MKHIKNMVDANNDSFYKLDDDLLRHIVDLLPMKDALRTSVLSLRWRYLWRSISNIVLFNLKFRSIRERSCILDSIDRLLVHHDSSDIKRFVARNVYIDAARFHRWISEVIKHNVQELRIDYSDCSNVYAEPCILPVSLFKCESLTSLEINMGVNSIILGSASSLFSVHLPSLKRLKLLKAVFLNNHSTQEFFSNIPKLQQLCLFKCNWENVNRLIINIPTLEEVEVVCYGVGSRNRGCQVTITAPNLTSFNCETDFYKDFLLSDYSSSLNVILDVCNPDNDGTGRLAAIRFLQSVKYSMSLHMKWSFSKWLNLIEITAKDLPLYTNLKHWEISMDYPSFIDAHLKKILMLLHNMPNLQSLTVILPDHRNDQEWESWSDVPSCVTHQIKEICISSQTSNFWYAMALTNYLMRYSLSLETLEVIWLDYYSNPMKYFVDQIKTHPRYSQLKSFSCSTNILPRPSTWTRPC